VNVHFLCSTLLQAPILFTTVSQVCIYTMTRIPRGHGGAHTTISFPMPGAENRGLKRLHVIHWKRPPLSPKLQYPTLQNGSPILAPCSRDSILHTKCQCWYGECWLQNGAFERQKPCPLVPCACGICTTEYRHFGTNLELAVRAWRRAMCKYAIQHVRYPPPIGVLLVLHPTMFPRGDSTTACPRAIAATRHADVCPRPLTRTWRWRLRPHTVPLACLEPQSPPPSLWLRRQSLSSSDS
jgi:hypothetical protein